MNYDQVFIDLKQKIESKWATINLDQSIYGLQIQRDTKFNRGLSEIEIRAYENELQISFPEVLKAFLRTINGTDKDGINVYGGEEKPSYAKIFYTYPFDIGLIKMHIDRVYDCFGTSLSNLRENNLSPIFPIFSHRFILTETNQNEIISIYYDDSIYWEENLVKLLDNEILESNKISFDDHNPISNNSLDFWLS